MHRELVEWIADNTAAGASGQSHDQSRDGETTPSALGDVTAGDDGERVIALPRPPPSLRVTNMVEVVHDR